MEKYRIGGADAPVIFGLSKWRTPLELYSIKKGIIEKPPFAEGLRQQVGLALEPLLLENYKKAMDLKDGDVVTQYAYPDNLRKRKDYEWMMGSLDAEARIGGKDIVVELKTANSFGDWGEGDDEIPKDYLLQVHHYFNCTGFEEAHIPVLFTDKMSFKTYKVERNEELCDLVMEACLEFYERLMNDNPPDVECDGDLALKYKEVVGESEIEADEKIAERVAKLKELKAQEKALGKEIDAEELMIKNYLGSREKLYYEGKFIASYKESESMRFQTEAFKTEHPDLYLKFAAKSKYRRFLLK